MQEAYALIIRQLRRGRDRCVFGEGETPIYVNVDMRDGSLLNTWIDALQVCFRACLFVKNCLIINNLDEG